MPAFVYFLMFIVIVICAFLLIGNALYDDTLNAQKIRKRKQQRSIRLPFEQDESWLILARPEDVSVITPAGLTLHAYLVERENAPYVILCHSYTSHARMMSKAGKAFYEQGFGVLLVDARGHGKSEGRNIGMGWLERKDIIQWIAYLLERENAPEIVLYGVAMGAATVMMTAGEKLPPHVKAVVEDGGYTSAWEVFAANIRQVFRLPVFPFLTVADWMTDFRAGYSLRTASAIQQVHRSHTPILFLHGGEDTVVPPSMAGRLYTAATCEKDLHIFENSTHGMCAADYGEEYWRVVFAFLTRYVTVLQKKDSADDAGQGTASVDAEGQERGAIAPDTDPEGDQSDLKQQDAAPDADLDADEELEPDEIQ